MTKLITPSGQQSQSLSLWSISNDYTAGDLVATDNKLYVANNDIPANTPFTIGTTGTTWSLAFRGHNPQPKILLPYAGTVWGRLFAYGKTIFRAGAVGRIGGEGLDQAPHGSYELPCITKSPNWVKIGAAVSNFVGLGDDGVLYVYGENGYGALGDGTTTDCHHIKPNTDPKIYGPGITVLDFWLTNKDSLPDTQCASVYVNVNDNGTLRTYAFGYSGANGVLGTGSTANTNATPAECVALRGKRIVKADIVTSNVTMVTDTGEVWGAGYNPHGQLGLGNFTSAITTFQRAKLDAINFVTNAVDAQIAWREGAGVCQFILLGDGTVVASGYQNDGMLGDGVTGAVNRNYFKNVMSQAGPLTGIVKIQANYHGLMALDSDGNVWWTGLNFDNVWGDGSAKDAANANYVANLKHRNMKDIWFQTGPRYSLGVFYLNKNNVLYAAGYNVDSQLGVKYSATDTFVTRLEEVALPQGEYPVEMYHTGAVNNSNSSFRGNLCLTNKGRIYAWGESAGDIYPLAPDDSTYLQPRWPVQIADWYAPNNQG